MYKQTNLIYIVFNMGDYKYCATVHDIASLTNFLISNRNLIKGIEGLQVVKGSKYFVKGCVKILLNSVTETVTMISDEQRIELMNESC